MSPRVEMEVKSIAQADEEARQDDVPEAEDGERESTSAV